MTDLTVVHGDERLPQRFWDKVAIEGKHWIWTARFRHKKGVAIPEFYRGPVNTSSAHRIAYLVLVGEVGNLRRICSDWRCIFPGHYVPAEGIPRGPMYDTCINGHPKTEEHARMRSSGKHIYLACFTCRREQDRQRRARAAEDRAACTDPGRSTP